MKVKDSEGEAEAGREVVLMEKNTHKHTLWLRHNAFFIWLLDEKATISVADLLWHVAKVLTSGHLLQDPWHAQIYTKMHI